METSTLRLLHPILTLPSNMYVFTRTQSHTLSLSLSLSDKTQTHNHIHKRTLNILHKQIGDNRSVLIRGHGPSRTELKTSELIENDRGVQ